MTAFLDNLNLRPNERRLVVFVALAVFVVLNIWLVWPQFGQVSVWDNRRSDAEKKVSQFQTEIARKSFYEKTLSALQVLGGQIPADEQAIQLQKDVLSYAALTGVAIINSSSIQRQGSGGRGTNAFFEEQTMQISVNTGERELVDFLYNLGKRNSMIRVRTMNLQPDQTHLRLNGTIALVASYQKKPPARTVAAAAGLPKPAAARPPVAGVKTNPPAVKANPPPKTSPMPSKTNTPAARTNAPLRSISTTTVKPTGTQPNPAAKTNPPAKKPPTPTGK